MIFVVVGAVSERQLHAAEIAADFKGATFAGAVHVEARFATRNSSLLCAATEYGSTVTVVVLVAVATTEILAGAVMVLVATVVTLTCCVENL